MCAYQKLLHAARPSVYSLEGSRLLGLPGLYVITQLPIHGPLVPGSTRSAETSLILSICRSTNQTYGSAKTPAINTTPLEEDRLSAPDSASPASTPTGKCLTIIHE